MAPELKLAAVNGEFYRDKQDERDGQDISTRFFLLQESFSDLQAWRCLHVVAYLDTIQTLVPNILKDAIALGADALTRTQFVIARSAATWRSRCCK